MNIVLSEFTQNDFISFIKRVTGMIMDANHMVLETIQSVQKMICSGSEIAEKGGIDSM